MITRISYTRAQSIGTCGRAYRFRYIDRLEPVATSIAMPFGKAVHGPVTDYVIAHALSKPFDIPALEKLVGHLFAAFQSGPAAAAPG